MLLTLAFSATAAPPNVVDKLRTSQDASLDAAVVVGIEDYPFLPDVPYAGRDADAFYNFLVYTRGVPPTRLTLLTSNPTADDIRDAIRDRAADVGEGGVLWLYFAGHGAADPESGQRLLLGVDVQPKVTSLSSGQTFGLDELDELVREAQVDQVMTVVDACYTGTGRDGKVLLEGKRFAVPTWATAPSASIANWSAAGPAETSGPFAAAQHGMFTYFAVGALRGWADGEFDGQPDGVVTLAEARQYVYDAVRTVSGGEQAPTLETSEDLLTLTLVSGVSLEVGPDLAELVARPDEVPKPPEATAGAAPSDFEARLAELKRLRDTRRALEAEEARAAAALAADQQAYRAQARARILLEATAAWAQTTAFLEDGGEESAAAVELFVSVHQGAHVAMPDGTTEAVKVPEVETALAWLARHGAASPIPEAQSGGGYPPAADLLGTLGSLHDHAYWTIPFGSERRAKRMWGKLDRYPTDDELWGDKGDKAVKKGDLELAAFFYLHALAFDPRDAEWSGNLIAMGLPEVLVLAAADGLRGDLDNDEAWGDLGDALAEADRTSDACDTWLQAADLDPADGEWAAKIEGFGCYGLVGRRGDALETARAVAEAHPDDDEAIGDLGDALLQAGRVDEACTAYETALQLDPADGEWPAKLLSCLETGLVVSVAGAPPADAATVRNQIGGIATSNPAISGMVARMDAEPGNDELWGDLAPILLGADAALAVAAYEVAMGFDPMDREWQTAIAQLAGYDRLFEVFQQLLQAQPSNDELLGDYGDRLVDAGRGDEACGAYRSAAQFDPEDTEWQARVAECDGTAPTDASPVPVYTHIDDEALVILADQLAADRRNDERWGDYGDRLHALGHSDEACEVYHQANRLDPVDTEWIDALTGLACPQTPAEVRIAEENDDEVVGDQADARWAQGDVQGACDGYRAALEIDPADQEWPDKMIACLIRLDPREDEALGDLGDRLVSWGQIPAACRAYREALTIDRDDPEWKDRRRECRSVDE